MAEMSRELFWAKKLSFIVSYQEMYYQCTFKTLKSFTSFQFAFSIKQIMY